MKQIILNYKAAIFKSIFRFKLIKFNCIRPQIKVSRIKGPSAEDSAPLHPPLQRARLSTQLSKRQGKIRDSRVHASSSKMIKLDWLMKIA